ncbi:PAS domain S-box protein [Coleofasciculus sp. FACHB-1120]|uniref:hybrid sensor histidine kinase/response regulator n=1 Tax=Coleofasciculus sp. FACHB-1120 TaxID=2692783 RepID=UPI001684233C|nr:PAS domain S-box protein [Coleofasciculus sp. FACHB-1120]MBD2740563.1 PAS domain S-box protein [Coleofasciculus sp. FACHB-1120]
MLKVTRSQLRRYGIAALSVTLTLLLLLLLPPTKTSISPLFFAAVTFSAWYGGLGPGVVATIVAVLANNYFFVPPIYQLVISRETDVLQVVVFSLVALLISSLNAELLAAKQRSEASLSKLQVSYRRLIDTAHEGIWLINPDLRTDYVNQRLAEMLGYSVQEMRDRSVFDFINLEDQTEAEQHIERSKQGIREQFDFRLRRKNGSDLWAILATNPMLNQQGEFIGVLTMLTDITERKQTEKALQESEKRFRRLVEANMFGVTFAHFNGRIDYANDAFLKLVGYEREDLLSGRLSWEEITPPEYLHLDMQAQEELKKSGVCTPYEKEYIRKDGSRVPILIGCALLQEPYDQQQEGMAFFVDLSDRKRAEEALQLRSLALQNQQQWLEDVLNLMPSPLLFIEPGTGRVLFANRAADELAGGEFPKNKPAEEYHTIYYCTDATGAQIPDEQMPGVRVARGERLNGFEMNWHTPGAIRPLILFGDTLPPMHGHSSVCVVMFQDISKRKQAEAALRQSQERYSTLARVSRVGLFHTDSQGKCLYTNERWCELTGISPEAALGEGWETALHPEDRQRIFAEWYQAAQENRLFQSEYRYQHSDGSVIWVLGQAAPEIGENGETIGYVGTVTDISDRKQIEIALQESEIRLRRIVDSNIIGIFFGDLSGNITEANDALLHIIGYTRQDLQAGEISWNLMTPPEYIDRTQQAVQELREQGVCVPFEKELIRKDGSRVFVLMGTALFEGSLQEQGVCYVLDLSERKRAEEERAQLIRQLEAERAQMEATIQSMPDALYIGDATRGIWKCNDLAIKMLGFKSSDGLKHNIASLAEQIQTRYLDTGERIPPEDEIFAHALRGTAKVSEVIVRQVNSGRDLVVRSAAAPIWCNGEIIGAVAVNTDITEEKRAEEERDRLFKLEQAARAEAESANRIKDEFLAVLSHEVRTPLNPILGWAKLLRSRKFDEKTTARALETIERNAELQSRLIEDLLDISRILQGKLSLNIAPVNLVATIEEAMETVRLAAEVKSIQIHSAIASNLGKVLGDANRLQQVVWNLLSNAVKFTPIGGQVEIQLSQVPSPETSEFIQNSYAQIQVTDTGKGIHPDFLPFVFDSFRQADSQTTRVSGGLGLGLAIVHHLVELHGGTVAAASLGEGRGATFTVTLPLMTDAPQISQENPSLDSPNLEEVKLLVVDDEVDTRELIVFILEECGAQVRAVASAAEALEVLAQMTPDLLLSDIGMPEMDGYMLIRQIRARSAEEGGEIPAIALTAYAGETDHQQILKAGFQKHLTKPIEPDELAIAIASLISSIPH